MIWRFKTPDIVGGALLVLMCAFVGAASVQACSSSQAQAKVAKAEADLCAARAAYKLADAATGNRLDAAPGSPRASLEAAEDAFCAARGAP